MKTPVPGYQSGGIVQRMATGGTVPDVSSPIKFLTWAATDPQQTIDVDLNVTATIDEDAIEQSAIEAGKVADDAINESRAVAYQPDNDLLFGYAQTMRDVGDMTVEQVALSQMQLTSALTETNAEFHGDLVKAGEDYNGELSDISRTASGDLIDASQDLNDGINDAIERSVDAAIDAVQAFDSALDRLANSDRDFNIGIDESILDIRRGLMTEEEVRVSRLTELRRLQSEAARALASGDLEYAAQLNADIIGIARDLGNETVDAAGNIIVSQEDAASQGIALLEQARSFGNQVNEAEKAKATALHEQKLIEINADKESRIAALNEEFVTESAGIQATKAEAIAAANEEHAVIMNNIYEEQASRVQSEKEVAAAEDREEADLTAASTDSTNAIATTSDEINKSTSLFSEASDNWINAFSVFGASQIGRAHV